MEIVYRGGRAGGGLGRQGWITEGRLQQPFGLKQQCCSLSMGPELIQSTGWDVAAVKSNLVSYVVLLMPLRAKKCILVIQQHR